jgi:hypothetical protein
MSYVRLSHGRATCAGGEERVIKKEARVVRVRVSYTCGVLLIERYRLSRQNRNALEEIVHGLALKVDGGRPSVFEWLRGPLLVSKGCTGFRTGAAEDEARASKGETSRIWLRGPLHLGLFHWLLAQVLEYPLQMYSG